MHQPRTWQVERFLSVQRAARALSDSAGDWWRTLISSSNTIVTSESLDDLYRQSLAAMQAVLGADEVSILLADDGEEALVARISVGLGEEGTVKLRIPSGEGMAGRVLATRDSLVVPDLSRITLSSPVLQERGLRSVVAVPILSESHILGVLHAGSHELDHFTDSDAELLGFLAERLAIAFERVRLFEEQRRLARVSQFLAETAKIMASAADLGETLDALAQAALPAMGDLCLIDVVDGGSLRRIVARHRDPDRQWLADRLRTEFPPTLNGRHPAARVMKSGDSHWSPTMSDEFLLSTTHNPEHFALTKALGFRSYLAVPISSGRDAIGTLTMVSCSRPLTKHDVELAEGLARQVGSVVAKAQQLETTAQTSHMLQAALLPSELPEVPGLAIESRYVAAASSLEVGGDFYDVVVPDGDAFVMIGDVEGHDRRAAAVMGQLRSAIRALACQRLSPEEIVRALQDSWNYFGFDRTATMLLGQVDPDTGLLKLASAGHLPPLLIRQASADYLPVPSSPLLGWETGKEHALFTELSPGDTVLFYTDGALHERSLGVVGGMDRLRKVALDGEMTPEAVCDRVIRDNDNREDDVALLAFSLLSVSSEGS